MTGEEAHLRAFHELTHGCVGSALNVIDHDTGEPLEVVEVFDEDFNLTITVRREQNECK